MTDLLEKYKNKKIALVLSGGVVKAAAWHLGVALALEELGFTLKSNKTHSENEHNFKRSLEIDTYVGSSAGAMLSILLATGYTSQEIINGILGHKTSPLKKLTYKEVFYFKRNKINTPKPTNYDPLGELPYLIRKSLSPFTSFSGFFSTEGIRRYLIEHVIDNDDFNSIIPDLFIVGTQLDHSRKVIFGKYQYPNPSHDITANYKTGVKISEAAAASMAVPPFYAPYPIYNPDQGIYEYYIDGEIRETLSTHVAEDNKCDLIISSWTHTPYHYKKEIGSLINYGLPTIAIQSIYLLIQKKIVSSRAKRATGIDIINTVNQYMKHNNFSNKHIREISSILESRLNIDTKTTLIDIHPDHDDHKLFFSNSFSLNPDVSSYTVKMGYKKTMKVFKELT